MSETPIFDQLAAEFLTEHGSSYESLLTPSPKPPVFYPERVVEPVQKVVPKPGAVRKADKPFFRVEHDRPDMIHVDLTNNEWLSVSDHDEEDTSDNWRLTKFREMYEKGIMTAEEARTRLLVPEVTTLFDKPQKTPYRTDKKPYTGADTQEIDVTFLRTTKTLQPLE